MQQLKWIGAIAVMGAMLGTAGVVYAKSCSGPVYERLTLEPVSATVDGQEQPLDDYQERRIELRMETPGEFAPDYREELLFVIFDDPEAIQPSRSIAFEREVMR